MREGIRGQTDGNHSHRQLANLITQTTASSNSVKLSHAVWGHPRQMDHGGESDRMWSTGEGHGKPLRYCCLEIPMNSMKKSRDQERKICLGVTDSHVQNEFSNDFEEQKQSNLINHLLVLCLSSYVSKYWACIGSKREMGILIIFVNILWVFSEVCFRRGPHIAK